MATERKRRQYGTGGVHQRASDGRWIGTVEAGWTARGTRRRITVSATTEAEARRRLRDKQLAIAREGIPSAAATASESVRGYSERWLQRRQDAVRSGTWSTDASMVRRWIVPSIGSRKMSALDTDAVHAVERAASRTLADSSLVRLRATLDRMLRDARLDGHSLPDRIFDVPRSAPGESDRDALPLDDALAVLAAAAERPDASRWVAALLQGMRQAECLGLRWEHVDLDAGTLDVSWQLKPVRYVHDCGEPVTGRYPCGRRFGGDCPRRRLHRKRGEEIRPLHGALCLVRPKSRAGGRRIPLVPWMSAALESWRQVAPPSPHGLVWPRPDGRPQLAADDDRAWYDVQDTAKVARVEGTQGRRYYTHESRHTTATLLLEAGVSEAVVIAIMGHSKISTTRGYQHVSQALARKALDEVAGRLGLTAG